ncbi:SigB/SigF/SigG family RNA polymerase sigma factor [Streptomyces sp. NPDC002564]|uniref:SigB/SigF/SigG family RNA polymerase sigma factor n=1 Tax=Streptomyces sp. NPDC002564 TaxID=3364649 RepID=UPI00369B917E
MTSRHPHDDAPDTARTFARFTACPAGRERDALCAELVEAWLPMAHRLAIRFRNKGENVDDLKQVAALGLVKAVTRFDPARGAFETYAIPTITGELRRHFRDYTWDVRVPRRVQDLRNKVRVARRELAQRPGRLQTEPSLYEMAEQAHLTTDEVRDGMEALESYRTLSLDADTTFEGGGLNIAGTLGAGDPGFDLAIDRESAKEALKNLPERDRTILYLRFFEDWSQTRIADQVGLSQMHVSRLIAKSCAHVRTCAA